MTVAEAEASGPVAQPPGGWNMLPAYQAMMGCVQQQDSAGVVRHTSIALAQFPTDIAGVGRYSVNRRRSVAACSSKREGNRISKRS